MHNQGLQPPDADADNGVSLINVVVFGPLSIWLHELADPMDEQGFVHISQLPGLGMNIDFDYIEKNRV